MAFNINKFNSNIGKHGIAKASHYDVLITPPTGIQFPGSTGGYNMYEHLDFRAESVDLPGIIAATTEYRSYGPFKKIAYGSLFDNINMSFICSHNLREKVFFDHWVQNITGISENGSVSSHNIKYYDDYKSTIYLGIYNEQKTTPTYVMVLNEAFPTTITPINLNRGSQDLIKINVSIAYHTWERYSWDDTSLPLRNYFRSFNLNRVLDVINIL